MSFSSEFLIQFSPQNFMCWWIQVKFSWKIPCEIHMKWVDFACVMNRYFEDNGTTVLAACLDWKYMHFIHIQFYWIVSTQYMYIVQWINCLVISSFTLITVEWINLHFYWHKQIYLKMIPADLRFGVDHRLRYSCRCIKSRQ